MKNLILIISLLCFYIFSIEGQSNFTRTFKDFHSLDVSGDMIVEIKQGDSCKMIIKKAEGIEPEKIKTELEGGRLSLDSKLDLGNKIEVHVLIYYKKLTDISAHGPVEINGSDVLKGKYLSFVANRSAIARFKVDAEKVTATCSSGGLLVLEGETKSQELKVLSGATISAFELKSLKTKVAAHTGGDAKVHAEEFLDARAVSGGDIVYTGKPDKINKDTSLGGNIEKYQ